MTFGLVDYGRGNLASVHKALTISGVEVLRLQEPSDFLKNLSAIVFPGQGHFGEAMNILNERNLITPIQEWLDQDKPFLGICLGFQLLFQESEESPGIPGLGRFDGKVVRFPSSVGKIPHMGWNTVTPSPESLVTTSDSPPYFYHVHSYYPTDVPKDLVACTTDYGIRFVSGIHQGNLHAFQFHPEKSQTNGLRLLQNFVNLARKTKPAF